MHHSETGSLYDILNQDHVRIDAMLNKVITADKADIDAQVRQFAEMAEEILLHLEAEERFLYTVLEQHEPLVHTVLESYEQHVLAKTVISAFNSLALDDKRWLPKIKVLKKIFALHSEQEQELLQAAKEVLTPEQSQAIAEQMLELKRRGRGAEMHRPMPL